MLHLHGNGARSTLYITTGKSTRSVQFIRLVPQLLNVHQLNATIEMEGSKDHSNAASGDGVSKHYGFQTRPVIQLTLITTLTL